MDRAHLALLLDAFDNAMRSPIGQAFQSVCDLIFLKGSGPVSLNSVRDRLLNCEYSTFEDYRKDLEETVNESVRCLSPDNEVSIALYTLYQMIIENSKDFSDRDTGKYRECLASLTKPVKEFAHGAPNSRDKFREFSRQIPRRDRSEDKGGVSTPNVSHIDVHQLKIMIDRLRTDEDEHELVGLIARYEPEYRKAVSTIEVDLKKLHPETLLMVWNFMVKKVPIPRTEAASPVKRAASTPYALQQQRQRTDTQKVVFRSPLTPKLPNTSPFLANLPPSSLSPSPTKSPKTAFLKENPVPLSPQSLTKTAAALASRVSVKEEPVKKGEVQRPVVQVGSAVPAAKPPEQAQQKRQETMAENKTESVQK